MLETDLERSFVMPKKRFSPEQIVTLLRQIEVTMGQGKSAQLAYWEAGISEQNFYRWRKEYGGLDLGQARRMWMRRQSLSRPNMFSILWR
jgi:hypothetical protein